MVEVGGLNLKVLIIAVVAVVACISAAGAGPIKLAQNSNGSSGAGSTPEEPGAKLLDSAVIGPKSTALVFFTAGWCYPCRKMASNLVAVGKLPVVQIDVSANPKLASNYSIKDLPTILLFSKGVSVDQKVGIVSESEISAWVTKATGGR